MGLRYLFLILAILGIWLILRSWWTKHNQRISPTQRPQIKTDDMLVCDYCGVHFPASDGVQQEALKFCCREHADSYYKQQNDDTRD